MPKKTEVEYCLWKATCVSLGMEKSFEGCDLYRCCYTCSKKARCDYSCKDRDKASHSCPYITSKEKTESKIAYKFERNQSSEIRKKRTKTIETKPPLKTRQNTPKPTKQKSKVLWDVSAPLVPTSVKELAAQTGATYARANYLIKIKKLSFADAVRVLKS